MKHSESTGEATAAESVFRRYSAYYDLLYRDKNYEDEVAYVERTIRRVAPAARTVLEFGSGTGRHGRLLARRGFDVLGVERSESMASVAREGGQAENPGTFDCVRGDVRTATVARTFDAVIALFHVVSYQASNDDLLATFTNAARHLAVGGVFLFDVWHGPAVLTQRPAMRHKCVENADIRLNRIAEPTLDETSSVVTVRYTMFVESKGDGSITTFDETHYMRYLFPTEIDLMARATGFVVERTEEFQTGAAASATTWSVAYVLRKSSDVQLTG